MASQRSIQANKQKMKGVKALQRCPFHRHVEGDEEERRWGMTEEFERKSSLVDRC